MTLDEMIAKTGHRQGGFRFIADELLKQPHHQWVIETGCARQPDNWEGDGQSTLIWLGLPEAFVESYDIDRDALTRLTVASKDGYDLDQYETDSSAVLRDADGRFEGFPGDSVARLLRSADNLSIGHGYCHLLYLDSMDVDMQNPHAAAQHALYEFIAARPLIGPGTLIAVDDNLMNSETGKLVGKGMYIADFMERIGKKPVFIGYQMVWRW